jgi:guanine deaminase
MNAKFMREAIDLSIRRMRRGAGGPFGAVMIRRGEVIARGWNRVTSSNDPTAHAEIVAIRGACRALETFHLGDCDLYTSCEPCPMCLSAIYWAHIRNVFYGATRKDAARIDFDDDFIYREIARPIGRRRIRMKQLLRPEALVAFKEWENKEDKVRY